MPFLSLCLCVLCAAVLNQCFQILKLDFQHRGAEDPETQRKLLDICSNLE
jgi:hypothetical protein